MDMLGKLFGGGSDENDHAANAQDFISRYQTGPVDQGYSDEEAARHYQNVSQHMDPATMQRASEQAFAGMDPNQRAQMAQLLQQQNGGQPVNADPRQMAGMVSQMHQQNPNALASLFGGGGGGMGGALGGLLGGGNSGGGGLGGLLGGGNSGGGGGGFPGGNLGKVALGGIAAYAMKEVLGGGGGGNSNNKQRRSV
jgi:hypothetical protein